MVNISDASHKCMNEMGDAQLQCQTSRILTLLRKQQSLMMDKVPQRYLVNCTCRSLGTKTLHQFKALNNK